MHNETWDLSGERGKKSNRACLQRIWTGEPSAIDGGRSVGDAVASGRILRMDRLKQKKAKEKEEKSSKPTLGNHSAEAQEIDQTQKKINAVGRVAAKKEQ